MMRDPMSTRVLRPIRAVACPRDLKLVPAAKCVECEDEVRGNRPHKRFWVRCGYIGGGLEYAKMRSEMEVEA